jgi:hypothetical protein
MAAAKRLTAEADRGEVEEGGRLQGLGATIPAVCKQLGMGEQTCPPPPPSPQILGHIGLESR